MKTTVATLIILASLTTNAKETKEHNNIILFSQGVSQPSDRKIEGAVQLTYIRKFERVFFGGTIGSPSLLTVSVGFGF